jgi:hypothetical protein
MSGEFIDFYLEFRSLQKAGGMTDKEQAEAILAKAQSLCNAGSSGVAITYSANEHQTDDLEKAYAGGHYRAGITGANQAQVMRHLEMLLGDANWCDLQMKMRIAPITTIAYSSEPHTIIKRDLQRIKSYLSDGWVVLGWQNQGSKGTDHPYAVGGGVVSLPDDIVDAIQGGLKALAREFSAR